MTHIVLIGPPGSGKSSIAAAFVTATDEVYEHISSGKIARDLALCDDLAQSALQRGDYAPESAMREEIKRHVERAVFNGKQVMLDGFPRMMAQVVVLEEALKESPLYIELVCPSYICMSRAIKRGREHDRPDAIASRFEAFERDTRPMIKTLLDGAKRANLNNYGSVSIDAAVQTLKDMVGI